MNLAIPEMNVSLSDILYILSGLLPATEVNGATLAVREVIIDHAKHDGPRGLFSISGVKFTTSRLVAEKTLNRIFPENKKSKTSSPPICAISQHGIFDLRLSAMGPDQHHVVEDVAICLGKAFNQALGDRQGIVRMSHAIVPMDETLAIVALDIGGRGCTVFEAPFENTSISEMAVDLIRHFFVSFACEAKINIHAKVLSGINDHHKAEALFKALARALDAATRIDERIAGKIPSTKDSIEK